MIWVLGVSHRTAPIELRERVAMSDDQAKTALRELVASGVITEAMVLSTCNRTELYFVTDSVSLDSEGGDSNPEAGPSERMNEEGQAVRRALDVMKLSPSDVGSRVYLYRGREAARHLFRVASSLDSLVVGEPQILGQLKRGFECARAAGVVGQSLHRLALRSFRAAKRVRAETTIGIGQVSVATVALDLARQIFDRLEGRTVALIGSGEMGEAIARLFQQAGAKLILLGRNEQRVTALAARCCGEARAMSDLERTLSETCVLVTSTSATTPIVTYGQVRASLRHRRGRDLFIVDVAVPRDVEEKVGALDGVYLYNVDDLSAVVAGTHASRLQGSRQAEEIVASELLRYEQREEIEQVTPTVRSLYSWYSNVLRTEVERSFQGRLSGLGPVEQDALERLVGAATKKLLHQAATRLKEWAVERPEAELEEALRIVRELLLPTDVNTSRLETGACSDGAERSQPDPSQDSELSSSSTENPP